MYWYFKVLQNYFNFRGRAPRREYWFFVLFNLLFALALSVIDTVTGLYSAEYGIGYLGGIYALFVLLPSLAVTVRRLHDTGRSGWWILVSLIPLLGYLILLAFMVFGSEASTNRFGPNPNRDPNLIIDSENNSGRF
ncbi:inner membrane protein YhaH [Microbulbifer aestuariivivens]|uniref:Inner membrane protein YhaH n=1 Tax=Microbulbifer aestuariivivens TaxID=1908308 RepID=A0ABP9WPQ1_9GAMM